MSAKVAFVGLGVMGFPMAGHLKAKGYDVVVYNRTGAKAEEWVKKHGGKSAPTPAAAAKDADFVMTMVGNDDDVLAVTSAKDGVLSAMRKGAILVDHTTPRPTNATFADIFTLLDEIGSRPIASRRPG